MNALVVASHPNHRPAGQDGLCLHSPILAHASHASRAIRTELHYSLVERAVKLGWPRERVKVIDEDLGKSGADAFARGGFQYLLAQMSLARAGLVLSFDASRLARNNRDWYQLRAASARFLAP